MRFRTCLFLCLGLVAACGGTDGEPVSGLAAPVVYGIDDRLEVYNHPVDELREIAQQSIVALIPSFRVNREANGEYSIFADSLKTVRSLCPGELFGDQPTAASCSGVLIDHDLVLTAGHCVDPPTPCGSYAYVFNYHYDGPGRLAEVRDQDVYSCERVVSQGRAAFGELTPDYAVIQLDRPVEGDQAPARIRPATALGRSEGLSMIGFGSGLPAKIDSGGSVADPRAAALDFFVANVDAFQGHSGSATFDSENRLAGILIGGRTPDYETFDAEGCSRVSVYEDSQAGEIVHNVAPIIATLCEDGLASDGLCDPDACDGQPCGSSPLPSNTAGVYASRSSGCSAMAGRPSPPSGLLALTLLGAAWALRRRAARPR